MLPYAQHAVVDPAKVRDYLLSVSHPVGRFKATVFFALGYTTENWQVLRDDLLTLAHSARATPGQSGPYGQKFEVSGTLRGPSGRAAKITSVWLLPVGESVPRFITAYPG